MMKPMKYLFYFLVSFIFLFPATNSFSSIKAGPVTIGGAIRSNYTFGDYLPEEGYSSRAEEDGGTIQLDIFRINVDFAQDDFVGKFEYRFYPGYDVNNTDGFHMLHTGWIGYNFKDKSQVQVGVNRVPFGPGAYGVSQSWFFDQHYYVGLADDMDLGIKYSKTFGDLALDVAYYASDEGTYNGSTKDSTRYSYDAVDETGDGYEERNQFNLRAIYTIATDNFSTALGASLQYGMLKSNGRQDDGNHYAGSIHSVIKFANFTLAPQVTYYKYNIDPYNYDAETGQMAMDDTLVQFGAFDFPNLVAAEAWVPAVSLSYHLDTAQVDWLDYIVPYIEYSSIVKEEDSFNDSDLAVVGAAWASGGWYIYTDLAFSNGNDFVGKKANFDSAPYGEVPSNYTAWTTNRFGANPVDEWEYRVNINFGYYF